MPSTSHYYIITSNYLVGLFIPHQLPSKPYSMIYGHVTLIIPLRYLPRYLILHQLSSLGTFLGTLHIWEVRLNMLREN
jgi:hypothetical protein